MSSVKSELVRIQRDTESLVSLVDADADISRELSDDISRFADEVQTAVGHISAATSSTVEMLDEKLTDLRERCITAIENTGALLHRGQQEQAKAIGGSVLVAGVVSGLFSLLGMAVAGRLVSNAISRSSKNRPTTTEELKEAALILLIAELQEERTLIPSDLVIERATGPQAILSEEETRRMLVLLCGEGALERESLSQDAPFRLNATHSKVKPILDRYLQTNPPPSPRGPRQHDFIDLGPDLGLSLSLERAEAVQMIRVEKASKGYQVVLHSDDDHHYYSQKIQTHEEAERLRLEVQKKLTDFIGKVSKSEQPENPKEVEQPQPEDVLVDFNKKISGRP